MGVPAHDTRDFALARALAIPMRAVVRPPAAWLEQRGLPPGRAGRRVAGGVHRARRVDRRRRPDRRPAEPGGRRRDRARADRARRRRRADRLQAARLAVQPPALLGRADPDRVRRATAGRSRCPTRSCRSGSRTSTTSRPAQDLDERLGRRCRRSRARPTGSTSSSTSATARGAYRRETNTMPQWAGSCWYYLRYLDPDERRRARRPGGRALLDALAAASTSTSAASSTPCCTCSTPASGTRSCSTSGYVGTPEPFARLFNQGYVQAAAYTDERGFYVEASEVERRGDRSSTRGGRSPAATGRWARA